MNLTEEQKQLLAESEALPVPDPDNLMLDIAKAASQLVFLITIPTTTSSFELISLDDDLSLFPYLNI